MSNLFGLLDGAANGGNNQPGGGLWIIIIYVAVIVFFMYFFVSRPQKKKEAAQASMLSSLEIGDSVLTTAGFYGVIIDLTDDTVIVEFGNNKNCRIPMQKQAIVQVEKANSEE